MERVHDELYGAGSNFRNARKEFIGRQPIPFIREATGSPVFYWPVIVFYIGQPQVPIDGNGAEVVINSKRRQDWGQFEWETFRTQRDSRRYPIETNVFCEGPVTDHQSYSVRYEADLFVVVMGSNRVVACEDQAQEGADSEPQGDGRTEVWV